MTSGFAITNDMAVTFYVVFLYMQLYPYDKLPEVGLLNQREHAKATYLLPPFSLLTPTLYFQRHLGVLKMLIMLGHSLAQRPPRLPTTYT